MRSSALLLGFLLLGTSAHAQATTANPAVTTARQLWEQLTNYITTAAQDTPSRFTPIAPLPKYGALGSLSATWPGRRT
jgi:hypothetical protein